MPSSLLSRADLEAAAGGNPALRQFLEAVIKDSQAHKSFTGFQEIEREDPVQVRPVGIAGGLKNAPMPRGGIQPPKAAKWSVTGVDGAFIIDITNPDAQLDPAAQGTLTPVQFKRRFQRAPGHLLSDLDFETKPETSFRVHAPRPIIHQIQSSLDLNFNANSSVDTYGPSPNVHYRITDRANQTRYWRFRSKYGNSDWNVWTYWVDPTLCGVVAVWSGLLRTQSLTVVNAANTPNVQPLTQSGTTTRINVAATSQTFGSAPNVSYSGGFVDPGSYGHYYVYCLDPKRLGGSVVYLATTSNPAITNDDTLVYFGAITTAGGGGGVGSGGGGGPCCIGEVEVDMFDGSKKRNDQLRKGDVLKGIDGGPEPIVQIEMVPDTPCFRYTAENGLILRGCSAEHNLQYDGGGFDKAFLIVSGHRVETAQGPTRVIREFIGHRTVYKLRLSGRTKTYIADGYYSHNLLKTS